MKSIRELITLMEGITSVPGIGPNPGGSSESEPKLGEATLNEIKASTHASYLKKASRDVGNKMHDAAAFADTAGHAVDTDATADEWMSAAHGQKRKADNRLAGIEKSADRLASGRVTTNEKSTSEKQARFMAAAAHNPDFAKKAGISQGVAKEFNQADTGTKQLSNAMKKDECTMSVFEGAVSEVLFRQTMDRLMQLSDAFVPLEDAIETVTNELEQQGLSNEEISALMAEVDRDLWGDDVDSVFGDDIDDMQTDADDLASTDRGFDKDYGNNDFPMEEDMIQNGYHDVEVASGNDFFPNGADSPVVRSTGPSGARQGDNPEQKKMQVDEVHKELVYNYRSFLKE